MQRIFTLIVLFLLQFQSISGLVFAGDSTSFNPLPITVVAKGGVPVGTVIAWPANKNPEDPENWLECDGRSISRSAYPELYAVVGSKVPDYRNQFMRGGTTAQVGQVTADTMRSHYHGQPSHTHNVGTQLSSTAMSGTAAAQKFTDRHTGTSLSPPSPTWGSVSRWGYVHSVSGEGVTSMRDDAYFYGDSTNHYTDGPSSVSGSLINGSASGTAQAAGNDNTYEYGGAETAPQHIRVRYLIRALP